MDVVKNESKKCLLAPHVPPTRLSEIRPSRRKSDEGRSSIIFPSVKSRASVSAARANAVPVSPSPETASNRFSLSVSLCSLLITAWSAWLTNSAVVGSNNKWDSLYCEENNFGIFLFDCKILT